MGYSPRVAMCVYVCVYIYVCVCTCVCPKNPLRFGLLSLSVTRETEQSSLCSGLFSVVTCLLCSIYSVAMLNSVSQCSTLHLKLPSLLLPLRVLASSQELSGPFQTSRNPAALSSSASPPGPAPPPPGCTLLPPHCPASSPMSTSWPGSPAEVDLSFQPFPGNHKHTNQREVLENPGVAGAVVRGPCTHRAEELWPHQRDMMPGDTQARMSSGEPPLAPARYPEDTPASGASRGDSFLVWFRPPCWLMLKEACLSLIRSVEGLTPARLTASLPPGKRAIEILL